MVACQANPPSKCQSADSSDASADELVACAGAEYIDLSSQPVAIAARGLANALASVSTFLGSLHAQLSLRCAGNRSSQVHVALSALLPAGSERVRARQNHASRTVLNALGSVSGRCTWISPATARSADPWGAFASDRE
jgi:hypothetical protein